MIDKHWKELIHDEKFSIDRKNILVKEKFADFDGTLRTSKITQNENILRKSKGLTNTLHN